MAILKPVPLKRGDKIGILAPSGVVQAAQLKKGVGILEREGFQVELAEGISDRKGYLAGTPEKRAKALQSFFERNDIRAIFCARGGFGSIQLLPLLNVETIRSNPKIFVGYSDVSVILNWLVQSCGLVAFHGPMVLMDMVRGLEERSKDFFWGTLCATSHRWHVNSLDVVWPGKPGRGSVQGGVVGGCLSVIITTLGTPFEIHTEGKILFLEEIGEKPYRIERMLTHLKMAGKLEHVAGVVFGQFIDCGMDEERGVREIIQEIFQGAGYPVLWGLHAGHGEVNLLLPYGVTMALDGAAGSLTLMESPTVKP